MPHDPKFVEFLIAAALGKAVGEERAAYLRAACGHDEQLRVHLAALLKIREGPACSPRPSPPEEEREKSPASSGLGSPDQRPTPGGERLGWALGNQTRPVQSEG